MSLLLFTHQAAVLRSPCVYDIQLGTRASLQHMARQNHHCLSNTFC